MSIYDQIARGWQGNPVGNFQQGQEFQNQNRLSQLQLKAKEMELDNMPEQNRLSNRLNRLKVDQAQYNLNNPNADVSYGKNFAGWGVGPDDSNVPLMVNDKGEVSIPEMPKGITGYRNPKAPIKIDTGDAIEFYDGITNKLIRSVPKQVSPDKRPETIAAGEDAKQEQLFKWKPLIESAVSTAKAQAQGQGDAVVNLAGMKASLPGVKETAQRMKVLADSATYTLFGKGWDWAVKQTGFGETQGATDSANFISLLDNQVLPMLKPIFGAAFTAVEGDRLRATLGDPDAGPEAKKAAIDNFVRQIELNIQAKENEIKQLGGGQQQTNPQPQNQQPANDLSKYSDEQLIQMLQGAQ